MEQAEGGLIKVVAAQREELPATGADLFVTVKGSSLVSGGEALKKAREVRQLVDELGRIGLGEAAIQLQRIRAETSSGVILKASAAHYELRVRCRTLDLLGDAIGVVTGQKHIELNRLAWQYADDDEMRNRWVAACIARANARARAIAEALGVRLLGVHSLVEHYVDDADGRDYAGPPGAVKSRGAGMGGAARLSAEDFGLELTHLKQVQVQVEVEYRVSGFQAAS